ncbi:disease resistance protein RGA2-like [Typha angustifolia]|uniref:disease resistance protein RGA2-like n=1 Tax=Typha angustifolia TaxID=59011 RepID=UPI003C2DEF00
MAMSTAAGIFGSPTLQVLLDKTSTFLQRKYELHSCVKSKLERLEELLIEVQSVVEAAEKMQQIQNQSLKRWLINLKNVAYQADDLLDTFEYRRLQQIAEGEVSSTNSSSSRVFICVCDTVKSLFSPDEDVEELSNLVERLERIASNVGNFIQLLSSDGQSKKPADVAGQRITGGLLALEHSFVGRVKEKEEIINVLLRTETYGANGNVPVLPLIGMGGVGKTTLAQVVYNDERVQSHFSLKMWVCVSENFDVDRLTREMLDQSGRHASSYAGVTSFNKLQELLKDKLRLEKFLLILDDIWNETQRQAWDTLKAPLCYGKDGSKILLTSRLKEAAKLMGTMDPIELQGLPEDEYWSFFKEQSFGGANPEEHPRLVAIGKEIASKLKGSPLAAKTVGGLLKDNLDVDHWESISKSEIWELEKGEDGIMAALKLSYLHLPSHLQQCFAYLSIYPKDWRFKREDVIRMWMAQGMIHHDSTRKRIEDVGEGYLNELISKSFFQSTRYYENHYTIHDLLHDLAESVSKEDCLRIEGDEFGTIPKTILHLYLNPKHLAKLKEYTFVLNNLRTLIVSGNTSLDYGSIPDVVTQLRRIRLLTLNNCRMRKCPDNLKHLRYLDLSKKITELPNYDITDLPDGLTKLYHLQTLKIHGMQLNHFPEGMNLINLRHFIYSVGLIKNLSWIGKMTCLQGLCWYPVNEAPNNQLAPLKYLRELRGHLRIEYLEFVGGEEEAREARLCDKGNLDKLELWWGSGERNIQPIEVENGILEGLRPHRNLKELVICLYRGTRSPSWLDHSLANLVVLCLISCRAWEDLPPLGQLPRLKVLKLRIMHVVKEVGRGFHGGRGFPSLEQLIFEDLPQWEAWSTDETVPLFPVLENLQINKCPKLKAVMPLSATLQTSEIRKVGLVPLPCRDPGWVEGVLEGGEEIVSSFPQGLRQLTRLKSLVITNCKELSSLLSLTEERVPLFPYLQRLQIRDCPKLKAIPPIPSTLQTLHISYVGLTTFPKFLRTSCPSNSLSLSSTSFSLRSLKLSMLPDLTTISFPKRMQRLTRLEELVINDCKELSSLVSLEAILSLKELTILRCPKLTPPPFSGIDQVEGEEIGLSSVSTLRIDNTLLLKVLFSRKGLAGIEELEICGSNELEIDKETFQHLTSLRKLHIQNCKSLQALPELKNLHSLKKLNIMMCPNFQSLPSKGGMPPFLQSLLAICCNPLFTERYHNNGPHRPTIANIRDIRIC